MFEFNTVADNIASSGVAKSMICTAVGQQRIANNIFYSGDQMQVSQTNCNFEFNVSNMGLGGSLSQDLARPQDFEDAGKTVRPEDIEDSLALGDDPGVWRERIDQWRDAGFTHLALHNVAPEQRSFIEFARQFIS